MALSALIAAGPWLDPPERAYAERLADDWNERLESWCYVKDSALAQELGVAGYYVRIAHVHRSHDWTGRVQLCNRDGELILASALVSLDFSYLVRLGLRRADDPRIKDTLKVVDHVLRVETPSGPLYHRYNEDGYGEHADGRAFDGSGIGRGWPLLVGSGDIWRCNPAKIQSAICKPYGIARARAACCPSRSGTLRRSIPSGSCPAALRAARCRCCGRTLNS